MPDENRPRGRPHKEGLDYAGWSTSLFDNEGRMDKLLDAQGAGGFLVYFYLCQRAYGRNGYFYPWSYDDAATTARKIGGGVGSGTVKSTVNLCLRIGLFDKDLFARHGILTSGDLQKVLRDVMLRRGSGRKLIREYWLLSGEESAGLSFCTLEPELPAENANYRHEKPICLPQTKENKTEAKETRAAAAAPLRELTEYWQSLGGVVSVLVQADLERFLRSGLEPDAIREAMNEAGLAGVRGWKYPKRILERYLDEGLKTLAQVKAQGRRKADGTIDRPPIGRRLGVHV